MEKSSEKGIRDFFFPPQKCCRNPPPCSFSPSWLCAFAPLPTLSTPLALVVASSLNTTTAEQGLSTNQPSTNSMSGQQNLAPVQPRWRSRRLLFDAGLFC